MAESPRIVTDLPPNMDLLFASEYQDKYVTKLRELARQHNQDLSVKGSSSSDKQQQQQAQLPPYPTMHLQSISPTPSTSSNSSCGSNIRHFKKTLILQSNLDGSESVGIKEPGSDGSFGSEPPPTKTESISSSSSSQHNTNYPFSTMHTTTATAVSDSSPFDMVNLLGTGKPKREQEVKEEELDFLDSDDEKDRQLTIVSDGGLSVASSTDSCKPAELHSSPMISPGKVDFSIRSLTSTNNTTSSSSIKYHSDEDDGHNRSSISIKTDNESLKSETSEPDHDMKSEDDSLKPITPEQFDFLRPSTSSFHTAASLAVPSASPRSRTSSPNRSPCPSPSPSPSPSLSPCPSLNPSPGPSPNASFIGGDQFGVMPQMPTMPTLVPTHVGRKPLNGPPCSLKTLVDDNILDPLDGSLTYEIMGTKFMGDLLPTGFIRMSGSQQVFANPSSWANFCRTSVASCAKDQKNYGSAWSIIRYLGKRLDSYKLRWYRKQKKQYSGSNGGGGGSERKSSVQQYSGQVEPRGGHGGKNSNRNSQRDQSNGTLFGAYSQMLNNLQSNSLASMANLAQFGLSQMPKNNSDMKNFLSYMNRDRLWKLDKVSTGDIEINSEDINDENVINFTSIDLNNKEALLRENNQVGAVPFNQVYCLQPFMVNLCTNALLLIDFHSHLATIELSGYLGGTWDPRAQVLTIHQAYPLKYTKSETEVEKQTSKIKENLMEKGWILAGWYHTHPDKGPHPSVNDVKRQLKFQKTMLTSNKKGTLVDYSPVVGLIVSPFYQRTTKLTSLFQMIWVMPLFVNNCRDFGRPMQMSYNVTRDAFLTQDLLVEMRLCATALANHDKFVRFREEFRYETTLWDKVYASLKDKLPRDLIEANSPTTVQNEIQQQALSHFWTFLKTLLLGPN